MSKHLEYSSPLPRFPGAGRICLVLALAFVLIVQRALETHGKKSRWKCCALANEREYQNYG